MKKDAEKLAEEAENAVLVERDDDDEGYISKTELRGCPVAEGGRHTIISQWSFKVVSQQWMDPEVGDIVERAGYVSVEQQIRELQRAGELLLKFRQDSGGRFDYGPDQEPDDDYFDPTREPNFDWTDADRVVQSLSDTEERKRAVLLSREKQEEAEGPSESRAPVEKPSERHEEVSPSPRRDSQPLNAPKNETGST